MFRATHILLFFLMLAPAHGDYQRRRRRRTRSDEYVTVSMPEGVYVKEGERGDYYFGKKGYYSLTTGEFTPYLPEDLSDKPIGKDFSVSDLKKLLPTDGDVAERDKVSRIMAVRRAIEADQDEKSGRNDESSKTDYRYMVLLAAFLFGYYKVYRFFQKKD